LINLLSRALFWPESIKIHRENHVPSALTRLPAHTVLKIFGIALRAWTSNISKKNQTAINKIAEIQAGKFFAFSTCIVAAMFLERAGLVVFFAAFAIMPLLDWVLWDSNLERSLRRELSVREAELGLSEPVLRLSEESETQMKLAKPLTDDELAELRRTLASKSSIDRSNLTSMTRTQWEERAGLKSAASDQRNSTNKSLREYLEEQS
jgi:hypothetical protein